MRFLILETLRDSGKPISQLIDCAQCITVDYHAFTQQKLDSCLELIIVNAASDMDKAAKIFSRLRQNRIIPPILVILPRECSEQLVQSASQIADDLQFLPLCIEELRVRIGRILNRRYDSQKSLEHNLRNELGLAQLIGEHGSFRKALDQVRLYGPSDASVLITGETGTGKELFAHALHALSNFRNGPFIPVNCGGIPEHLAENELFGHRRGAFTDARSDQRGLAGMAEGGSLFLDEIDSLSLGNQAKLLRFLQERTYRPLGADKYSQSHVRVIAATNRCLEDAVREKEFRSDLYFRLSVLRLQLPPLRARDCDVAVLAEHFLRIHCSEGRKVLSPEAIRKLESHDWPGNVRELYNVLQRASICSPGGEIQPEHITLDSELTSENVIVHPGCLTTAKKAVIERFERRYVSQLMSRYQGNVTRAAEEAGKERRSFGRLVKKYGVARHH